MSLSDSQILLTGGSGRLGKELRQLLPGIAAPSRGELDITQPQTIEDALNTVQPRIVVHAAAYTDVAGAESERGTCWGVNVDGTRHLAQAAARRNLLLVHISTDYVFDGVSGGYKEDDPVGPVRNYYALSKLVAEEVVRFVPRHLVIRTSFRPREWPYPTAFTDVFTSQDYVDVLAPLLAQAILHIEDVPYHTLHIATERKSTYELARRRRADVQAASKRDVPVQLPDDITLNTDRWQRLATLWKADETF